MSETPTPPADNNTTPGAENTTETPPVETKPEQTPASKPSLLDGAPPAPETKPEEQKPEEQNHPEWFLADGVKGKGPPPEWYKADKYKTVDEQAKAYAELEKRFGGFVGAPKDGKYPDVQMPEGVVGEFDTSHPIFTEFDKLCLENQVSPAFREKLMHTFARYEASMVPDMGEIKKQLGDKADEIIAANAQWAKANLGNDLYETFREATSERNAAAVLKVFDAIRAKTRQAVTPPPNKDDTPSSLSGLAQIDEMQARVNPKTGQRYYVEDPKYRADVEAKRAAYFQSLNS